MDTHASPGTSMAPPTAVSFTGNLVFLDGKGVPFYAAIQFEKSASSFWQRLAEAVAYLFGNDRITFYLTRDMVARLSAHYKVDALRRIDPETEALLALPTATELAS